MKWLVLILAAALSLLSLVLQPGTATAGALAHAGLTEMVICAGGGEGTIVLDRNGQPAEPSEDCCTCLSCLVFSPMAPPPPQNGLTPAGQRADLPDLPRNRPVYRAGASAHRPRGPPTQSLRRPIPASSPDVRQYDRISPVRLEFRQVDGSDSVTGRQALKEVA